MWLVATVLANTAPGIKVRINIVSLKVFIIRNRDTDVKNKHTDTKVESGVGVNWETGIAIHRLLILCM